MERIYRQILGKEERLLRKHGCRADGMLWANTQETVALWKCNNKQTKRGGEERGDEREKGKERDDLGGGCCLGCPLHFVTLASASLVAQLPQAPTFHRVTTAPPPQSLQRPHARTNGGGGGGTRCLYGLYGPKRLRTQLKEINTKEHTRNGSFEGETGKRRERGKE